MIINLSCTGLPCVRILTDLKAKVNTIQKRFISCSSQTKLLTNDNHHMRIWYGSERSYSVLRLNFVLGVFAELWINSGDWPQRCFATVHHKRLCVLRSTGRIARKREDDHRNERHVRCISYRSKKCSWPCTKRQLARNVQVSSQDSFYALVPDQPELHSTHTHHFIAFPKKKKNET